MFLLLQAGHTSTQEVWRISFSENSFEYSSYALDIDFLSQKSLMSVLKSDLFLEMAMFVIMQDILS